MTPEQLEEIEKLAEAATPGRYRPEGEHPDARFVAIACNYALPLVKALREAWEALDEREGDMHARIRAGYDKTVADMWRAHCAKIEKERDEACAEVERLRGIVEVNDRRLAAVWDEAHAEVERLREAVRQIAAAIERAADVKAASVVLGEPIGGAAVVYDLRRFAEDLRQAAGAKP